MEVTAKAAVSPALAAMLDGVMPVMTGGEPDAPVEVTATLSMLILGCDPVGVVPVVVLRS